MDPSQTLIASRHNERYKALADVGRKGRWKQAYWCEGFRLCRTALDSGAEALALVVTPEFAEKQPERLAEIEALLEGGPDRIIEIGRSGSYQTMLLKEDLFARLAGTQTPQGIALLLARRPLRPLRESPVHPRVLVLDRVQDPGNAGTLLRSAAAFGFTQVVTVSGTVDLWGDKALRAGLGTTFAEEIHQNHDIDEIYSWLRDAGATILCADLGGTPLGDMAQIASPLALVLGNEGNGVSESARAGADHVVTIELSGEVESLNVAIAGSILLHHYRRP